MKIANVAGLLCWVFAAIVCGALTLLLVAPPLLLWWYIDPDAVLGADGDAEPEPRAEALGKLIRYFFLVGHKATSASHS